MKSRFQVNSRCQVKCNYYSILSKTPLGKECSPSSWHAPMRSVYSSSSHSTQQAWRQSHHVTVWQHTHQNVFDVHILRATVCFINRLVVSATRDDACNHRCSWMPGFSEPATEMQLHVYVYIYEIQDYFTSQAGLCVKRFHCGNNYANLQHCHCAASQ